MNDDDHLSAAIGVEHFQGAKYFFTASCLVLFYDHALTFSREVERVWKQRLTLATLLFIIIRYLTPLELIVFFFGFDDPTLSAQNTCSGFLKFPGAATLSSIALIEVIMSLRTYALYGCNMVLLVCLLFLVACQASVMAVLVHNGRRVPLPIGVTGCVLTGRNAYLAAFWMSPLVLDTVIFTLTLYKTRQCRKKAQEVSLLRLLLKDGIIYYVVICGVNVLNVLVYLSAPIDLKAVGATFSYVMTTIMISRLVLNLQGFRAKHSSQNLRQLDVVNLDLTRTDSAVLTTQFQFDSLASLDIYPNWRSPSRDVGRRHSASTWLGTLEDRLADEDWGIAGVMHGVEGNAALDFREAQEMQTIVSGI
ncbi:hypothetical protein K439DRAFT_1412273 [Ramaria rubella]|nr:hypothetical protein K439DRAFT_1412273 [Ramaria rubella]